MTEAEDVLLLLTFHWKRVTRPAALSTFHRLYPVDDVSSGTWGSVDLMLAVVFFFWSKTKLKTRCFLFVSCYWQFGPDWRLNVGQWRCSVCSWMWSKWTVVSPNFKPTNWTEFDLSIILRLGKKPLCCHCVWIWDLKKTTWGSVTFLLFQDKHKHPSPFTLHPPPILHPTDPVWPWTC